MADEQCHGVANDERDERDPRRPGVQTGNQQREIEERERNRCPERDTADGGDERLVELRQGLIELGE
jgi:hypothetical protein